MLTSESRIADFPVLWKMTYLNTAAENIPPLVVKQAMEQYFEDKSLGMRGRDFEFAELERCRERTARLLNRKPEEVSFCSCTSEAYNLLGSALDLQPDDEVVITDLEFPSGATPWLRLSAQPSVRLWKNREGILDLADLESLLNEKTKLVQVSLVSFLTGYRIPWAPFRDLVRDRAPQAVLSVDVTQAAGRVVLDCLDADCLIASTYKWLLGIHGGCVVSVPKQSAERLTTRAGGWFHLANAFDSDRFERAEPVAGARSFSVGMPGFASIYALSAATKYLGDVGVPAIAAHADPLVAQVHAGLKEAGISPMSPAQPDCSSGIVAFQHHRDAEICEALLAEDIHVMHQAGRIRISVHGYNQPEDIDRLLAGISKALK